MDSNKNSRIGAISTKNNSETVANKLFSKLASKFRYTFSQCHYHYHYHHHHHQNYHHYHHIDRLGYPSIYSMYTWGDWRKVCITLLLINNYISLFHWMLFICNINRIPLMDTYIRGSIATAATGSLATDRGWVWVWHWQTGGVASELTVAPSSRAPNYSIIPSYNCCTIIKQN